MMLTHREIKKKFIDYFTSRGHAFVPSSSLIPSNDSSILFTNSGMVQFKKIFLGIDGPAHPTICNYQKCIRASGKHNDLDDVGKDSYHHTFFEMLGTWAFRGVYFKKEAVELAWGLLIKVYQLPIDRFYVTYFGGNPEMNLEPDLETKQLWLQYLPEERILPFGMKENFWEMATTGPCGPCTEIHYDKIGNRNAAGFVNKDDPAVIEIWNLVFMQYNRISDYKLEKLETVHVDTGAGFERIVAVIQNCTNYETDIFRDIISMITKTLTTETNIVHPYSDKYGKDDPDYYNMAYRVLADHLRTMVIAINDGCTPSSTERGYVIRRIIRRAIRFGTKFNATVGFLTHLANNVIDIIAPDYPELLDNKAHILEIIQIEGVGFSKTLKRGIKKFNDIIERERCLSGANGLLLYMSYGFPLDIIKQMAEEHNIKFDHEEFDKLLAEEKIKSKFKHHPLV